MFLINLQGKESIYEQIRNQIKDFIVRGILKPNDKLPSVRQVANELGINPNTVMKAYRNLETDGLIYTLDKKGAFVKGLSVNENVLKDAYRYIEMIRESKVSYKQLMEVVNEVYKEEKDA